MRNTLRCLAGLVLLMLVPLSAFATDLTKIERKIAKEPTYKTKPKYCLLVFGMEAKHRVWLVQDGDTLYIDRNGNGDLTEAGEKIAAEKREDSESGAFTFKLPELRAGDRLHKDLHVYVFGLDRFAEQSARAKEILKKNPKAPAYLIMAEIELPGWKGTGRGGRIQHGSFYEDAQGILQFADTPRDAPILHLGGTWQVTLFGLHKMSIGRETDMVLGVGTPGVGPGTTTFVYYEGVIPEKAFPIIEIVYPPKNAGDAPVREKHELKQRC